MGLLERITGREEKRLPVPFVVGVGRSGTTLLRLQLDAHSQLAVPPETGFIPDLIEAARAEGATPESLAAVLTNHRRWGDFGLEEADLVTRWRALPKLRPGGVVRSFYEAYADQQGKPRWGDKTPGYTRHISKISKVLPEARFIHLIRDGRDVAQSRVNTLALKPTPIGEAAKRWKKRLRKARRQGAGVEHYMEIRYEDLVTDTEATLRKVCDFVELPFEEGMLHHHERSQDRLAELDRDIPSMKGRLPRSAESRLALHERTTKPVDTKAIGKWRTKLTPEQIREFEEVAGDTLLELGYELAGDGDGATPATAETEPPAELTTPVVLVVGLQKSGTTLIHRLLEGVDGFTNPVNREGKELWGDDPPFSPEAFPAGTLYQEAGGARGHELAAEDATDEVCAHLRSELARLAGDAGALVLKNPYNSVRLPWLRTIFPDAHIVAIVRRPLPNVFSLVKKHVENPHAHRGPESGWWGVKPAGWEELASEDPVVQAARQWDAVNAKILADRDLVDTLVTYGELCAGPEAVVGRIAEAVTGERPELEIPKLEALDEEYLQGGSLESANRVFKRTGSLDMEDAERAEGRLDPFTAEQRAHVAEICRETAARAGLGEP